MRMKKLVAAVAASLGIAVAAPASAVIVGGIDFGALGATVHIETATLAETFVGAVGDTLRGYGLVTTVNSDATYCADGSANCALYYYFTGYTVTSLTGTYVTFAGGTVDIYYDPNPALSLFNQDSTANVALITAMTPWVEFDGHTFLDLVFGTTQTLNGVGSLTGATLSQSGTGQLDVDTSGSFGLASVAAYMNGNSIGDNLGGFADVVVTSSSNNFVLNPFDAAGPLADSCNTATPAVGDWCLQGTLNTRGATVIPEPATLALLGLALAGLGFSSRRKLS